MSNSEPKQKRGRPSIARGEVFDVWLAAGGRCTFCNCLVSENDELGEAVPIGELAHNVGWAETSPRGKESELDPEDRQAAENLILACRNCHKPIDQAGVVERYTVEELTTRKREHEDRIRTLTSIGPDRSAFVVRFAGSVRGVPPAMSRQHIQRAATEAGLYPRRLPGAFWEDIDLDTRDMGDPEFSSSENEEIRSRISRLVKQVHNGIEDDAVDRVALFAFARIPYLVELGAQFGDKAPLTVFKRHRDDAKPWRWPASNQSNEFATEVVREGESATAPTLIIELSGAIPLSDVEQLVPETSTVYALRPVGNVPDLGAVSSPADLLAFERTIRQFISSCENAHPTITTVHLFPAVDVASAVTLGRVLLPSVSPAWTVYDRDLSGDFQEAMRVAP
ncbi:MAG: SAVED domain-containing protein [Actinomycetota bacterium]